MPFIWVEKSTKSFSINKRKTYMVKINGTGGEILWQIPDSQHYPWNIMWSITFKATWVFKLEKCLILIIPTLFSWRSQKKENSSIFIRQSCLGYRCKPNKPLNLQWQPKNFRMRRRLLELSYTITNLYETKQILCSVNRIFLL